MTNLLPCPFCDGAGCRMVEVTIWGHDCGGDERLCAIRCPIQEIDFEPEPCERCGGTGKVKEEGK